MLAGVKLLLKGGIKFTFIMYNNSKSLFTVPPPIFIMEVFQTSLPVLKHLTLFIWVKSLIPVYKYLKIILLQASLTRINLQIFITVNSNNLD